MLIFAWSACVVLCTRRSIDSPRSVEINQHTTCRLDRTHVTASRNDALLTHAARCRCDKLLGTVTSIIQIKSFVVGVTHCHGRLPRSYKSFVVGVTHCHGRLPRSYKSFVVGVMHCHGRLPRSHKSFVVGVTHCHERLPRSYKSFVIGVTHCHGRLPR